MPISDEDFFESLRAYTESADDDNRVHAFCYVGSKDEIISTIFCTRGSAEEFRQRYEMLRDTCRTSTQPDWQQSEIGPIEDKLFFFSDDKLVLDPPMLRNKEKPASSFGNAIWDEWNAFQHLQTHGQERSRSKLQKPFYREVLELWRKRAIPYAEAVAKVSAMGIAPRPLGQKYSYGDADY